MVRLKATLPYNPHSYNRNALSQSTSPADRAAPSFCRPGPESGSPPQRLRGQPHEVSVKPASKARSASSPAQARHRVR